MNDLKLKTNARDSSTARTKNINTIGMLKICTHDINVETIRAWIHIFETLSVSIYFFADCTKYSGTFVLLMSC